MKRAVRVILKDEAEKEFEILNREVGEEIKVGVENSEKQQLLRSIKQKVELIRENPTFGSAVPKDLINKSKLHVDNLWIVDLTGYWRMVYTLQGDRIEIICFILKIVDHNRYNKIFGYKKK